MRWLSSRLHRFLLLAVGTIILIILSYGAMQAQSAGELCFAETGHCISSNIRQFWERNGGASIFGHPRGPLQEEFVNGKKVQAQWFERGRLEFNPSKPNDVLVGQLGLERLKMQKIDWRAFPPGQPREDDVCRFFGETQHNICAPFLQYWQEHGVELDGTPGKTDAESLALFGAPVSEPLAETIDGERYMVQWFERARLQYRPGEQPLAVSVGMLGSEMFPLMPATRIPPSPEVDPETGESTPSDPGPFPPAPPAPGAGINITLLPDEQPQTQTQGALKIVNNTGDSIRFRLDGPTKEAWSLEIGETLQVDVAPGTYVGLVQSMCGDGQKNINVKQGEVQLLDIPRCAAGTVKIENKTGGSVNFSLAGPISEKDTIGNGATYERLVLVGQYELYIETPCGAATEELTLADDGLSVVTLPECPMATIRLENNTGFIANFTVLGADGFNQRLANGQVHEQKVFPDEYQLSVDTRCGDKEEAITAIGGEVYTFIAGECVQSQLRVINSEQNASIKVNIVSGPELGSWSVAAGQTLERDMFTGDYQIAIETPCGNFTEDLTIEQNQIATLAPDKCPAAFLNVVNQSGGTVRFKLEGPTLNSGSIEDGGSSNFEIPSGSYGISFTTECGNLDETFSVSAGQRQTFTIPECPPPTPVASGSISVVNETGGSITVTLSGGPTTGTWTVQRGTTSLPVIPGNYVIRVRARCGSASREISVSEGTSQSSVWSCI